MSEQDKEKPILVTGAAGRVGGVGRKLVELLRAKGEKVRAVVRTEDERAEALRELGAQVVVADLTVNSDVVRVVTGCRRIYWGMAVSADYLSASLLMAVVAKQVAHDLELFVNLSQMTVSFMSVDNQTSSPQQQQHWLAEHALNWSGLPVVHVRPTVFLEHFFFSAWAADSIAKDGSLRLPFGNAKTSPISALDVARVCAHLLVDTNTSSHLSKVYELTGPVSLDLHSLSKVYSEALRRPVSYVDLPFSEWEASQLDPSGLPSHVREHLRTMAKLHAQNQYDRLTDGVLRLTGSPPLSLKDYVSLQSSPSGVFAKAAAPLS